MRRSVLVATLAAVAILAGACGADGDDVSIDTDHRRPELLYLGSGSSITALAPASGHIRFREAGAVPSRDWSVLYAATNDGLTTTLRTLDPATGDELASRELPGVFSVRTVSEDGSMVALAPPFPAGFGTYHPASKDPTPLVIVRRDVAEPQVLSVAGNVEPEAFSLDGGSLFVIDFVPPLSPERYRVARLDLDAGTVGDVRSSEQELQEPMRGTARAQVMAPDGRRLSTLYTRDATADRAGGGVRARVGPRPARGHVRRPPRRVRHRSARRARGDAVGNPPLRRRAGVSARSPSSTRRRRR